MIKMSTAQKKERQQYMKDKGFYTRQVDGGWGKYSVEATKKFQVFAKKYNKYCQSCLIDGDWGYETEKAYQSLKNNILEINVSNTVDPVDNTIFKNMIKQVTDNPNISKVFINKTGTIRKYVTLNQYKNMKARWDNWYKKEKVEAKIVYINKPSQLKPTSNFLSKFSKAVGRNIKTPEDIEAGIKGRKWLGYYDDKYDQETALKRLEKKEGLNCTDICQLVCQALKDLKYDVKYVHWMCAKDGGHIQITYKINGAWKRIDPSNALQGGSWSTLWCPSGYLIRYDSCFLLKDNGMGGACL